MRRLDQQPAVSHESGEFAGGTAVAEGLLRAPPRGRLPRPRLSAVAAANAERALAQRGWETPELLTRAARARRALVAARVGGEWWQSGGDAELPRKDGYTTVVLGEPMLAGEASPSDAILARMLHSALSENLPENVVVCAHPSVANRPGLREALAAATTRGAVVTRRPLDPWAALDPAGRVYSAGGEVGFLALIAGKPVSAFAAALYTGWGATQDAPGLPQRPFPRNVDQIFAGLCLVATRYRDPFRDTPASFEDIVEILADWRRIEESNRRIAVCVGMSFWKRRRIADFVRSAERAPVFRRSARGAVAAALRRGQHDGQPGAIAGWASRLPDGLAENAARRGVPLIRVEDGFVRSVGLGSDFLPPASLVFDSRGMYYDPSAPSDLEILLREAEFPAALVARAERLAEALVERGISKYNLRGRPKAVALPPDKRTIFVPGQVEDDLSVRLGGGAVRDNLALLEAVRTGNPDAFILYKPHPDVMAGHRKGAVPEAQARRFADLVVHDVPVPALLGLADEVHTMTSLAGFEALLRGRKVVVYGRPFYAGWGLTADMAPSDRGRALSLGELVAGVLILYPRYLDPLTRLPCGPEIIIERLDRPELWRPGPLVMARRLQGMILRRLGEIGAKLRAPAASGQAYPRERLRP